MSILRHFKRKLKWHMPSNDTKVSLSASLLTSIVPEKGQASSFTRSTVATVTDFEGVIKIAKINEARFEGARRVENLLRYTEDLTNAAWLKTNLTVNANQIIAPDGTLTADMCTMSVSFGSQVYQAFSVDGGSQYVFSFWAKRGTATDLRYSIYDQTNSADIVATTTYFSKVSTTGWTRIAVVFTAPATCTTVRVYPIRASSGTGTAYIWGVQCELVGGQSNQNPSEYVCVDVESFPFHGNGVGSVQYFSATNGNTVTNNVVTEAAGTPIATATLTGFLSESQSTNYCLYSNDLANAVWVKTNMTASTTATGPAGKANMATILTATAGNATCLQSITRASALRITSTWIKRRTGTGVINMTQDNGTTWAPVTVTSSWTRVKIASATLTNPIIGLQIVTNGDAVDVAYFQHEEGTNIFPSSGILTTSAATTRAADALKLIKDGFIKDPQGSIVMSVTPKWSTRNTSSAIFLREAGTGVDSVLGIYSPVTADNYLVCGRGNTSTTNQAAATTSAIVAGTLFKVGMTYNETKVYGYKNGASFADVDKVNAYSDLTLLDIGPNANATIKYLKVYSTALPIAKMNLLTAL